MATYQEFTLGLEAIRYIRESLSIGKTLAKTLLERADLADGKVITFLPADVAPIALNEFTTGGKLPEPPPDTHGYFTSPDGSRWRVVPLPNTDSFLAAQIQAFLGRGQGRICIFEDALAASKDPWIASSTTRLLIFGEEVYHVVSGYDARLEKVEEVIRWASRVYPPLIGVLAVVPPESDFAFNKKRETTVDELKAIVHSTEKIIIGAYDGESYLIWTKS